MTPNEPSQAKHPVLWVRSDADVTPAVAATRRATVAMRRLIAATVNGAASAEDLEAAADELERLADLLEPHARDSRYAGTPGVRRNGDNSAILESHPMIGPSNPLAPPISLTRDADGAHATVVYGHQYEGPPGRVHGGFIAAAFDQILGAAAALSGRVFFTGSLTVKYRKPTPLNVPIQMEGEIASTRPRTVHVTGRMLVNGEVTAEAEGVMVTVADDTFHGANSE
ncbi:MAG: PaaI family thioesterase [Acidimicrobiia bacterium]|nr:PaaI family thioesterase [Acidimicrobiia bacterium]